MEKSVGAHTLDSQIAIALVDTAIHFGIALEAERHGQQPNAIVPFATVLELAIRYDRRFRASFVKPFNPTDPASKLVKDLDWNAVFRKNTLDTAYTMGKKVAQHLAGGGAAAAVVPVVEPVELACQQFSSNQGGSGLLCASDF